MPDFKKKKKERLDLLEWIFSSNGTAMETAVSICQLKRLKVTCRQ